MVLSILQWVRLLMPGVLGLMLQRRFKPEMLDSLMQLVGMDKLILSDSMIVKSDPNMYIDVNAIAQGYSVDVICNYLAVSWC